MKNEDAKFILRAYRPDGRDSADPYFSAALEQARLDPTLRDWFTRELAADAAIAGALRHVAVPAHLQQSILAGARVSRRPEWWRRPALLALAAAIAVLLAVASFFTFSPSGELPTEHFAQLAARDLSINHHFMRHPTPGRVATWLAQPDTRVATGLPHSIAELRADRCRTVKFAGREVFEVCFDRDTGYHLYLTLRENVSDAPPGEPRIFEHRGLALATWSDARYVYVLATEAGPAALRRVL